MPRKQQKALEQVPGWLWDPLWLAGYERLRKFIRQEGTSFVPDNHVVDEGFHLGRWVRKQRWAYTMKRLLPQQRHMLEKLPEWTWDPYGAQRRGRLNSDKPR